ncbi:unnamed protein product [Mesocestoides corti]|uniref:Ion transport domain-containing protein n=2 Tax=Mesocestoides corti TaxID=53468 RepID=A0A0R3U457_MESCO|nr:unnamed protein product [Mesocestoides corti]
MISFIASVEQTFLGLTHNPNFEFLYYSKTFIKCLECIHFGVEGWSPYDFSQLANLLVILRTLRFTQTSSLMTSVLVQMPCHLSPVLGVLVSVYYIYALLGLSIFRGTIQHPTNTSFMSNETYECGTYQQLNYWAINFDDFAASIYTLWSLMVLNNWHVIVKAFSDELGRWVHIYTLSWWLIVAVVLLTLTTAMIIESFLFARQMHARRADLLASRKRRRTNPCALAFVNALTRNRQDDVVHEDEEELMPAFEHPREHINSPPQPPTPPSPEDDGETVLVQPPPSAVVYSFAQMFGQNLTEPTNEEMLHHLHRHREIGALISS